MENEGRNRNSVKARGRGMEEGETGVTGGSGEKDGKSGIRDGDGLENEGRKRTGWGGGVWYLGREGKGAPWVRG